MASTRASISKVSKRPKINIIPPKQLFVDLTQDDTKTPSPKLPNSSPSAPNAPSKTPSTKDTSSSSIDYIPKSPTSSTSLSPNGYLNPPTSPPPRVSPPPPTHENASMDITLTLSPNTPLDVQFDTPSPSPPIIAHPIPWNFLEAHGKARMETVPGKDYILLPLNKKDESGIVIKNKARLVAQGYTQEEGIDYDEVFSLVSRIEAIRLLLAHVSFKDFVVYQMDAKSAFLYGKIEEEVYVCQPLGFEDPDFQIRIQSEKDFMDCIKLPKIGMKPCQLICWTIGFRRKDRQDFVYQKGQSSGLRPGYNGQMRTYFTSPSWEKKIIITEATFRKATTTATGLDAKQDKGGGPHAHDTIGIPLHRLESVNVSKFSTDPPARARRIYTRFGLSARIIPHRMKLFSGVNQEDASKQEKKFMIYDADERPHPGIFMMLDMLGVLDLDEPKAKGLLVQEQEQASTPITSSKDKGKGIMVEEPLKMKKKDQVLFDEQEAIASSSFGQER
ncbi:gag-protease polyprotein [Tanacetum coccineum]